MKNLFAGKSADQLIGVSSNEFKSMIQRKDTIGSNIIVVKNIALAFGAASDKDVTTQLVAGNTRTLKFTCSTGAVDRDKDVIVQGGWDLSAYRSNPVLCWQHDMNIPIGRALKIGVVNGALQAKFELDPPETPVTGDYAEAALRKYRAGFLSAVSVGFRPLEFEISDDEKRSAGGWLPGVNFIRSELYEVSCVTVPANPEALIDPAERAAPIAQMAAAQMAAAEPAASEQAALELEQYEAARRRNAAIVAARKHRLAQLRAYGW